MRRTVFRSIFLVLATVILGSGVPGNIVDGQEVESRPVARLVDSVTYKRPRRSQPVNAETTLASNAVRAVNFAETNSIERRAFEQTNRERVKNGLSPLVWDGDLCRMARQHSEEMARLNYFSHTTPQGDRLRVRAREVGITHYKVLGENIAYNLGYDDPGGFAVERWMLSSGHRANILYGGFKAMAVGTFVAADGSVYITETFIAR